MNKYSKHLRRLWPVFAAALVFFVLGRMCSGTETVDEHTEQAEAHEHEDDQAAVWTCSMHPQIRASKPGQCPICGMDLIPVESDDGEEIGADEIRLSPRARTLAKIRTAPVRRLGAGGVDRRLLGRVDYDESSYRTITAWIGGRIDRLQVRVTGQRVRAGQTIATLYSPEVYTAHQDLLVAKEQLDRLGEAATGSAQSAGRAAYQAARDRLRLLGVPEAELRTMEKAKRPSEQIRIRTPFGGTIIERLATEGSYVTTGTGLYKIANLGRLWVQLDAYESDLPSLAPGQEVELKVEALPGEAFSGRVTFVDPVLDAKTRTARVRIEVRNRDGRLRPGMFAEAIVKGDSAKKGEAPLIIPATAALFTGRRSVVYVERDSADGPVYQARVVRLGPKMGEHYSVIAGLSAGQKVVVHGAFALDADLQIRGGVAMMAHPDDDETGAYDEIVEIPKQQRGRLEAGMSHYLGIHKALAADDLSAAKKSAAALAREVSKVKGTPTSDFGGVWIPLARHLLSHSKGVADAESIEAARLEFHDLSLAVATLLRVFGNPTDDTLRLASCPMALDNKGAEWVQKSETIENPYFGASMHSCGEIHESVAHGTYLPAKKTALKKTAAPQGGHSH